MSRMITLCARCDWCRWCSFPLPYCHDDKSDSLPTKYKCRRRAPVATGGMMSPAWTMWPEVHADDVCGEFEERMVERS